jgi:uncharacterized membrane protein YdjX (TVP38/TMEM64 family)
MPKPRRASSANAGPGKKSRPAWAKIALVIGASLLLAAAWKWTPLADYFTLTRINGWAHGMRQSAWAPVALTLAYTPAALVMFPRQIITLVAVIAFGPWWGFGTSFVGILLAALAFYVGGRYISYNRVKGWCGGHLDTVKDAAREHGVIAVFASNMAPVPPFSIQGLIAGAIKVKPWEYFAGTALSLLPGLVAIAFFGNEISRALAADEVNYWQMGLAVAFFAGFTWWARRWLLRREKQAGRRG